MHTYIHVVSSVQISLFLLSISGYILCTSYMNVLFVYTNRFLSTSTESKFHWIECYAINSSKKNPMQEQDTKILTLDRVFEWRHTHIKNRKEKPSASHSLFSSSAFHIGILSISTNFRFAHWDWYTRYDWVEMLIMVLYTYIHVRDDCNKKHERVE